MYKRDPVGVKGAEGGLPDRVPVMEINVQILQNLKKTVDKLNYLSSLSTV